MGKYQKVRIRNVKDLYSFFKENNTNKFLCLINKLFYKKNVLPSELLILYAVKHSKEFFCFQSNNKMKTQADYVSENIFEQ